METGTIILILSFAIPLTVVVIILYFMRRGFKKQIKFAGELTQKISAASPASAIVLSASQGLTGGDINRIIHLKLQVNDSFGQPYSANVTWFVDTLHFDKIREGNEIKIKIDKDNKNIIYPDEFWGRYTEGYENL